MLLKQQRQLIATGLVTQEQISEAMKGNKGQKAGLLLGLLDIPDIDGDKLLMALAKVYKVPFIDPMQVEVEPLLLEKCPEELCEEFCFVPIALNAGEMVIATADPMDYAGIDVLQFKLGQRVRPVFSSPTLIQKKIRELYGSFDDVMGDMDDTQAFASIEEDDTEADSAPSDLDALKKGAEGSPIIKLVNGIIVKAMQIGSSDIHIEAADGKSLVRMRVDGRLRSVMSFPHKAHPMLVSRIKIMSKLDISNTRTPQDGRTRVKFMSKSFDMRISTLPSMHGEKIVMRILDKSGLSLSLDVLAFEKKADERIRDAITRPTGAVLVTGPTGSGKTTTLYSFLHHINDEETNIVTVEDPVEFQIKGLNQVQVNAKSGMTFAAALRSILRQDPDVVMVGEIRDEETAHIALHAAQTGHLVMSTLHTNDAPSTVSRLVEMGADPVALSSCLNIIVAQRLARRLCPSCKKKTTPTSEMIAKYDMPEDLEIYEPVGCNKCLNIGYKGRCGVHETLYVNDRVRKAIANGVSDQELMQVCREEGMYALFEDGMNKVLQGVTSVAEVTRLSIAPEDFSFQDRIDSDGNLMSLGQANEARDQGQLAPKEDTKRNTILLIDDSKSIRSLVGFILKSEGFDIAEAEDGRKGLDLLKQALPQVALAIVDYDMPNMTGPEFVQEVRRQSKYDDIPVVMLTSRHDEDDEVLGLDSGADDYIIKPVEPMKLQARVRKILQMYERVRQAQQRQV
ncbi:ATPase, T2SS/T4P/T4SS family [Ghiorsea bivora]|uniref:ATPase, T2SS/T4P/T4SS family n=1 Tax=Ghiorsea bivora TaxID=1485545 RepID=UPI00056FD8A0|nr:ATPase, T2SS/T4P/T4SS family [Ghiorsea bivora]